MSRILLSVFSVLLLSVSFAHSAEVAPGSTRLSGNEISKIAGGHSWVAKKFSIYHMSAQKRVVKFGGKKVENKHWVDKEEYCAESISGGSFCMEMYKMADGKYQLLARGKDKSWIVNVVKGEQ